MTDDIVEVVKSRAPEGLAFYFKVRTNGQLYRFEATRWPRQPRYWCFSVTRYTSAGVADPGEVPWIGNAGMTREELPAAMQTVRTDIGAWLAQEEHRELRSWLLGAPERTAGSSRV